MQINTIREFLYLAEEMSFSNVAKNLFISQSALSKHIDAMEAELGTKLFVRDTRSVRLTNMGKLFQKRMKVIIGEYDAAIKDMKNAQRGIEKVLKVGYLHGACKDFIAEAYSQFEAMYPQTSLQLHTLEIGDALSQLKANKFDMVVIMKLPNINYGSFNHLEIYGDCLNVLVSRKHRLADRNWVSLDDLKGERVLIPSNEAQPDLYSFYRRVIKDPELWSHAEDSLRDINSALPYLSANTGVAITLAHLKSYYDIDVSFLPLVDVNSDFSIAAVWKVARENDAILAFANCLKIAYELKQRK